MYIMDDWQFLLIAYAQGGACNVPCPAVRATLERAGLMTPAKASHHGWRAQPFSMALTKQGRLRAEDIRWQRMTATRLRWERKLFHATLSKQPVLRRTRWHSHPSRFSV